MDRFVGLPELRVMWRDRSVFPQSCDNLSSGQEKPYSYILVHIACDIFWRFDRIDVHYIVPIYVEAFSIIYRDHIIGCYVEALIKYQALTAEPSSLADSKWTLSRSSVYRARVAR
jgi:hypothetical protein